MSEELKPCPFCGAEAVSGYQGDDDGGYHYVECSNPVFNSGHFCGFHNDSAEEAISGWNTRAETPQSIPSEREEIVAWLRKRSHLSDRQGMNAINNCANSIERGEHLPPPPAVSGLQDSQQGSGE